MNNKDPDVDCGGAGGISALRGLSDGSNIALCDGSVRFVKDTVGLQTWWALGTRNGNETISADSY